MPMPDDANADYAGNYNTTPTTPEAQVNDDGAIVQSLYSDRKEKQPSSSKKSHGKRCTKKSKNARVQSMDSDYEKDDKRNRHDSDRDMKAKNRDGRRDDKRHDQKDLRGNRTMADKKKRADNDKGQKAHDERAKRSHGSRDKVVPSMMHNNSQATDKHPHHNTMNSNHMSPHKHQKVETMPSQHHAKRHHDTVVQVERPKGY